MDVESIIDPLFVKCFDYTNNHEHTGDLSYEEKLKIAQELKNWLVNGGYIND